jgi:hypothetical protein
LTIFAPFVAIIHDINISSSFDAVLGLFHSFHGFPWLSSRHKKMINPLILLPSYLPKPSPPPTPQAIILLMLVNGSNIVPKKEFQQLNWIFLLLNEIHV